jgi:release factor glutamine methyltransferase
METRGRLVTEAAARLSAAGLIDPRRQARRLIAEALVISQTELFGHPDHAVNEEQTSRVRALLDRMAAGEPLSRLLERRAFWGLEFVLSTDTLDPRPETETVVEAVLNRHLDRDRPLVFLDLGTGSGCILLALLSEFPNASGIGVDIAEGAVRTAVRNSVLLGFADRAHFFVGDWTNSVAGRFDIIVSNPPYIATKALSLLPREVAYYDPWRALDGGEDGFCSYRKIAEAAPRLLFPHGIVVTEVGAGQADTVAIFMKVNGLQVEEIQRDLAGIARCVIARVALYGG